MKRSITELVKDLHDGMLRRVCRHLIIDIIYPQCQIHQFGYMFGSVCRGEFMNGLES